MQKLEQLQRKVRSAEELQSITRTMKIMSAVSIHQFEEAVRSLSEYFDTLELGMQIVLRSTYSNLIPSEKEDRTTRIGIIAIGSGQSLCGPFDEVMADYIRENVKVFGTEALHFMVLGERLADHLMKDGFVMDNVLEVPSSVEGISSVVLAMLNEIENWQADSKVESILLIHNKPMARKGFTPGTQHLLPLNKGWLDRLNSRPWKTNNLPQFTMDADVLFMSLLRQYLFVSLFRALAESLAAEYGSRLSSMQRAEKKIEERLGQLRNEFLHERQASITEELLDIMAGFEAVADRTR